MLPRCGSFDLSSGRRALLADQRLDRVAGRHQQVVADGAGVELGQHLVVVGVVVLLDAAAALPLEARQGLVAEVVVPVVEVQHVFGGGRHGEKHCTAEYAEYAEEFKGDAVLCALRTLR